jgi:hypothetical protein
MVVLEGALNVHHRTDKKAKFGFSTSEDALTWTVFSWLSTARPDGLVALGRRLFAAEVPTPEVLLWGVPITAGAAGTGTRDRMIRVLDALGERPNGRSEPDVILDFGTAGLVIIEVKHRASNDVQSVSAAHKFDRYLADTSAFTHPEIIKDTLLYELARNWRVGIEVAGDRPFRLVNLGAPKLFAGGPKGLLDRFEHGLSTANDRSFARITWPTFLADAQAATGPLPPWLTAWLGRRGIAA